MTQDIRTRRLRSLFTVLVLAGALLAVARPAGAQQPLTPRPEVIPPGATPALPALAPAPGTSASIVYKVQGANDRLEMIVNTSRILTLDQKIPQAQVNNPELLELVPLSPTQVQVSAKKSGVTQVNLWAEGKSTPYTIDVIVLGDARELALLLHTQFPRTALTVIPVGGSVMISGYVDQPETVPKITRIAEEFYPKVINNMTVSGVQQVVLHVKVMEVSRTKLRTLGFDFSKVSGGSSMMSGVSNLISTQPGATFGAPFSTPDNLFKFRVGSLTDGTAFFGVLNALRQDSLAKVLAEPDLVTISGRPAYFNEGGTINYQLLSSTGTPTTGSVNYGTRLDFVPLVLGNGRIHLDVRPSVSELDAANTPPNGIPATKTREAETGVEMQAGQTLAIAGLVQQRTESSNRGLPWISELPYVGFLFRSVSNQINEVELVILVTPELVEPMDACQVSQCGPGMQTANPSDWDLFFKGHLEVPNCGPGGGCAPYANGAPAMVPMGEGPTLAPPGSAVPAGPQNSYSPPKRNATPVSMTSNTEIPEPGFIGPIGYEVIK